MKFILVLLSVAACVYANKYSDIGIIKADLNGLLSAFESEKLAFEHIFDQTTETKVADKSACWKKTIDQILHASVDGTKLTRIQAVLHSINNNMGAISSQTLAAHRELVLTGNNTLITQILDESKLIADNLEYAMNTMLIDQNC